MPKLLLSRRLFAFECALEMAIKDRNCSRSGVEAAQQVVDDLGIMLEELRDQRDREISAMANELLGDEEGGEPVEPFDNDRISHEAGRI